MQVLSGMQKRKVLKHRGCGEHIAEERRKSQLKVTFLGGPRLLHLKLLINSKIKTNRLPLESGTPPSLFYCPQDCIRLMCIYDSGGLNSLEIQTQLNGYS